MKQEVMFGLKVALVVVLILAIHVAAAITLCADVESNVLGTRKDALAYNTEAFASHVAGRTEDFAAEASEWDGTESEKFSERLTLSGNALYREGVAYPISENVKNNLTNYAFNVYPESELFGEGDALVLLYTVAGEPVSVVLQTQAQFSSSLADFGLSGACLVADNGRFLTGDLAGQYFSQTAEGNFEDTFGRAVSVNVLKLNGSEVFFGAAPLKIFDRDYYAAGYQDAAAVVDAVRADKSRIILVVSLVSLSSLALMAAFILLILIRDRRERVRVGMDYDLVCDKMGKVLKANGIFRANFNTQNVFEGMDVAGELAEGTSLVLTLPDKYGVARSVAFVVNRDRAGLRLLGRELEVKRNEVRRFGLQRSVDLRTDFGKFVLHGKVLVGVIQITNLDTLKDMFGELFCEKVYYAVSERVKRRFSSFYAMIPDRVGILLGESREADEILRDMPQIMDELNHLVRVEENVIHANCRAGFAVVDKSMENRDCGYALSCVEAALKKAVADERQTYFIYHEAQKKQYSKYFEKECDIKKMLAEDSFELEFQPQVSLKTGKVCGFEALFRVKKHLTLDMSTQEVIEYAERSGSMIYLGNFIFNEAMRFAESIKGRGATVSLNVSPVQFMQAGFVDNFLNIYREYSLEPGSLCVEITETFLMNNFDETLEKLRLLRKSGIGVHLDDFGVSYSSLLYLKKLPITALKIDRAFIEDIETNEYSRAITTFIIRIAGQLGLSCISEGVETEIQRKILTELGCGVIQGYLTGRSQPAARARALVLGETLPDSPAPSAPANASASASSRPRQPAPDESAPASSRPRQTAPDESTPASSRPQKSTPPDERGQ